MEKQLHLEMLPQPDDFTCGATCLQAVYNYHNDPVPLEHLTDDVQHLEDGGTLGVYLGQHALDRGYRATIYSFDLDVFDPTWFDPEPADLVEKLTRQMEMKQGKKFGVASRAYIEFLRHGGRIRYADLTSDLIRHYLNRSTPIIAGLSSTCLYGSAREHEIRGEFEYDDIRGKPVGHFVVLCGYDRGRRTVSIADPYEPSQADGERYYEVDMYRLIGSILLGVLTYDANLLVIEPRERRDA